MKNKTLFHGNFVDSAYEKGELKCLKTGRVYTGEFNSKSERHGSGKLTFKKSQYDGNFKNGQFDGTGLLASEQRDEAYEGEFRKGKKHGIGVRIQRSSLIVAEYKNGEMLKELERTILIDFQHAGIGYEAKASITGGTIHAGCGKAKVDYIFKR